MSPVQTGFTIQQPLPVYIGISGEFKCMHIRQVFAHVLQMFVPLKYATEVVVVVSTCTECI